MGWVWWFNYHRLLEPIGYVSAVEHEETFNSSREANVNVFVTGATGFVGKQTARRLAQTGHEVRCLVRKSSRVTELKKMGLTLVTGDVTDRESVRRGMQGCEWVIHIAANTSFWERDKRIYADVNIGGTRNVMECALETGAEKVVHVSGVVIFGKPKDCPYTEDSAVGPVRFSEYGRTKYAGDLVAWDLHREQGLPLVMVYPGGITGPNDPKIAGQYIRDIVQRRMPVTVFHDVTFPWVHVRDVATAIVKAAEADDNIGEKYLLVAENLTFGETNELISEISGVPLPRLRLPDTVAVAGAALLTALSTVTRRPPPWGMAIDQVRTMRQGGRADGSKAARELGIAYTPIRVAFEDVIASIQK